MAVIDASVYVALINQGETGHERARSWFAEAIGAQPVSAPTILLSEVSAAISRGASDPELAREVVTQLRETNLVRLRTVDAALAAAAAELAARHRIRGCDAVYVALAAQLEEELVTLDRQQLERGALAVRTRRP